jgi:hypothetical protein
MHDRGQIAEIAAHKDHRVAALDGLRFGHVSSDVLKDEVAGFEFGNINTHLVLLRK